MISINIAYNNIKTQFIMKNTFSLYVLVLGIQLVFAFDKNIKFDHFPFNFTESNDLKTANYSKILLDYFMNSNDERSHLKLNDSTRFRPVECCGLESLLIELKKEDKKMHNKNLIYIPPCVRVNRCGGCCNTQGYSCESNGFMETINISVKVLEFSDTWRIKDKYISVMQHTKCKCVCGLKKENCSSLQIYNESQCACVCTNLESQQLCEEDRNKIWDKINCSCKCVNAEPCTTGLKLNLNTCSCEPLYLNDPDKNY